MNISQAAEATGVSAKMIRHYESIGVIPQPPRSPAGYRRYAAADIQRLRFIRRARAVGFDTAEVKKLLSLWQDQRRPARDVKRLAQDHLSRIEERIQELRLIAGALSQLLADCHGDDRPDCPILESLAEVSADGEKQRAYYGLRPRRQAPKRRSRQT